MPPKAKKGSTKAKKKPVPLGPPQPTPQSAINDLTSRHARITETLLATTPLRRDFVHLTLHLLDCPYVVNDWVVSISTQLSSIIDRLEREHGSMKPVRLYRIPACEENELTDRTLSLSDLGCVAGPLVDSLEAPVVRYDIVYDFLPSAENPILMREPDLRHVPLDPHRKTATEEKMEAEFAEQQNEAVQMLPYVGVHMQDSTFHGQRFHNDQGALLSGSDTSLFNTPVGAAKQFASQFA